MHFLFCYSITVGNIRCWLQTRQRRRLKRYRHRQTERIEAEEQIDFTLKKAKFFDRFKEQFNSRQLTAIKRMLEEGAKVGHFMANMNYRAKQFILVILVTVIFNT